VPVLTSSGKKGFAAVITDPSRTVLAFDYDGVLSPIIADPERAVAHPPAIAVLRRLAGTVGTVAVITGRPAEVVAQLGRLRDYPEFADIVVFGHYGRERWDPRTDEVAAPPPSPGVASVRAEVPAILAGLGLAEVVWVEDKGSAVAVHTRRAPDPTAAFDTLLAPLSALATEQGLVVEPGRLVLELRPAGSDKGSALRSVVEERGATSVVYAGDDLGDLSAFAAVDAMREEGIPGLKVCSGSAEAVEVARRADLVVDGPAGIAGFLEALADQLSRANSG
jgi:trehalose 6-phosphate phosphatase